ncbi:N-acetylmuramoyl-L-alanine amidase [Streptomyces ossamyceticus]|uniref:peptidoglycan recognition protein family protein n=1 Tax=Streptomyces ossamyceticus TaxID=249581 RepID=UPI0036F161CD
MAWYPGATKYELQPESDQQQAIVPTQFIVHSIAAPWTAKRTYEYWRDSTNLESHFGVDYVGDVGQYIGTETRADANAGANRRPDGTGAVSVETASNLQGSDPWNDKQVEDLIAIGVWLHREHGIPLRICRTHDDPGYGYHSMFPQWSTSGTACPGAARINQFREVVFPGIVARATGTPEENDMPTAAEVAKAVLTLDGVISVPGAPATNPTWTLSSVQTEILKRLDKANTALTAQAAAITSLAGQLGEDVDTAAVVAAVQQAIADAVVSVDINVNSKES